MEGNAPNTIITPETPTPQAPPPAPGTRRSPLLKVVSVIFIIFSVLYLIAAIVFVVIGIGMTIFTPIAGALFIAGIVVAFLGSILRFIAGIKGVSVSKGGKKTGGCIFLGIVLLVMSIYGIVSGAVNPDADVWTWTPSIVAAVLDILYICGAAQAR